MRRLLLIPFALLLVRCSSSSSDSGTSEHDAGMTIMDGSTPSDGGHGMPDAGSMVDAGPPDPCQGVAGMCVKFTAGMSDETAVRNAIVGADNNTTFVFGPGTFSFTHTLNIPSKDGLTIKGAG